MNPNLTDALCTRCGLCCDGSLFADVELAGCTEADRIAILGLDVEDDDGNGGLLSQPCRALHGTRCRIYAHRPECCRTFECRLLRNVRRGAAGIGPAVATIAEARGLVRRAETLLLRLGQRDRHLPLGERSAEALAGAARGHRAESQRAELTIAMSTLQRLIRRAFLGREKPCKTRDGRPAAERTVPGRSPGAGS